MTKNYANKNEKVYRVAVLIFFMFLFSKCIWTQEENTQPETDTGNKPFSQKDLNEKNLPESKNSTKIDSETLETVETIESFPKKDFVFTKDETQRAKSFYKFFLKDKFKKTAKAIKVFEESSIKLSEQIKPPKKQKAVEKFHWKPAIVESMYFLGIQQGFRMMQKKTSRELDGKFFPDWGKSVKNLGGWRDGDSFLTNYIAHPMQGAVTGRIFINNSDKSKKLEFGKSKEYWQSRAKAMLWSTVWSTQFELGPISEASIGNVGLYDHIGPNRMGWVDIVVTPIAGTGVIIGEDIIDKYILKKWLEKGRSRTRIKIFRTFFTPFQSFTNVLRGKAPWKRDNR